MFKRATRSDSKVKVALAGPSGSGKTYSALKIARGLVGPGGRIAVIDTEAGSASLYAHLTEFDAGELTAPYSPARYLEMIHGAVRDGYDCVIIDSITHEWDSSGGILDMKNAYDRSHPQSNSFTNWSQFSAVHTQFIQNIVQLPIHVIATIRTKTEWVIEENDRGKKTPRKIGTAPVQRGGIEYEFTVVFDIDQATHNATPSKDRTSLFDGKSEILSERTGERLAEWLRHDPSVIDADSYSTPAPAPAEIKATQALAEPAEADPDRHRKAFFAGLTEHFGKVTDAERRAIAGALAGMAEPPASMSDWGPGHYISLLKRLSSHTDECEGECSLLASVRGAALANATPAAAAKAECHSCGKTVSASQATLTKRQGGAVTCTTCQRAATAMAA